MIVSPIASVITPNLPEAAMMLDQPVASLIGVASLRLEAAYKKLSAPRYFVW